MDYSSLYDLITYIENGTRLHIGVLAIGNYGNEKCNLPSSHRVHSGKACAEFKSSPKGFRRCFRCRNIAVQKAISTQKTFYGYCINGIFEYVRPIVVDGDVAFIIFIGNILGENAEKIRSNLADKPEFIDTLEMGFTPKECDSVGNLIESYIRMLLRTVPQSKQNRSDQLIENIKNYADSNFEFDIKISHIANVFHYNEQYLGRLFKESTNQTFNEYLNSQRLIHSKDLLIDTDFTVLEISNRVGFNNISYFNRLFKKQFGLTPTEYRKQAVALATAP